MDRFGEIGNQALSKLSDASDSMREGAGEFVIWRHLDRSKRRPQSDNAMGIDPDGTDFEHTDYAVWATRTPEEEETRFYMGVSPDQGDLIITLQGDPSNEDDAFEATKTGFYRVHRAIPYHAPSSSSSQFEVITTAERSKRFSQ